MDRYRYVISQINGFHIPLLLHHLTIDPKLLRQLESSIRRCESYLRRNTRKNQLINRIVVNCIISQIVSIKQRYRNPHLRSVLDKFISFLLTWYKPRCSPVIRPLPRKDFCKRLIDYTLDPGCTPATLYHHTLGQIYRLCGEIKDPPLTGPHGVDPVFFGIPSFDQLCEPGNWLYHCRFTVFSDPYLPDGMFQGKTVPSLFFNNQYIRDIYRLYCVLVHEYVPGHLLEAAHGETRSHLSSEHWACLVEKMMSTISESDGLMRTSQLLQLERYVFTVVDIGINCPCFKWSYREATLFIRTGAIRGESPVPNFRGLLISTQEIKRGILRAMVRPGLTVTYTSRTDQFMDAYRQFYPVTTAGMKPIVSHFMHQSGSSST
jgi:hypothetical protein